LEKYSRRPPITAPKRLKAKAVAALDAAEKEVENTMAAIPIGKIVIRVIRL
jgi:hypothetical protein